ncbi:MAG: hypothetical protein Q8O43_00230 [Dehalococcoidia bacterium]|nr:hypothetical protein [Dehalococcoidia bacterium]
MLGKLTELIKVMNFESTAFTVFNRLVLEKGPGLFVLWGGNPGDVKKANKSYFLDMVETFEQGMAPTAANILPDQLQELLQQLDPSHYQCVRVIEDYLLPANGDVYATPLSIAIPLAIAGAAHRRGLEDGRNLVILCDDIQEFMKYNLRANEQYLHDLSLWLDRQTIVTFIGASQLTWNAKAVLDQDHFKGSHALALGWD